jgi:hypothetical protein
MVSFFEMGCPIWGEMVVASVINVLTRIITISSSGIMSLLVHEVNKNIDGNRIATNNDFI